MQPHESREREILALNKMEKLTSKNKTNLKENKNKKNNRFE